MGTNNNVDNALFQKVFRSFGNRIKKEIIPCFIYIKDGIEINMSNGFNIHLVEQIIQSYYFCYQAW